MEKEWSFHAGYMYYVARALLLTFEQVARAWDSLFFKDLSGSCLEPLETKTKEEESQFIVLS